MNALTDFPLDPAAEQRRIDRWSLAQARACLAEARAKSLPIAIAHQRKSVVSLYLRIRRQRRPA
ncbi:hypothetical protein [EBPR podovirus 2]|nr:hypothetical protein [EBPR podovirus 2]